MAYKKIDINDLAALIAADTKQQRVTYMTSFHVYDTHEMVLFLKANILHEPFKFKINKTELAEAINLLLGEKPDAMAKSAKLMALLTYSQLRESWATKLTISSWLRLDPGRFQPLKILWQSLAISC